MTLIENKNRTPIGVFLATAIIVFFMTLSAADSIGFVPYYIDGTSPSVATDMSAGATTTLTDSGASDSIALASLPQLGEGAAATTGSKPSSSGTALPARLEIPQIGLDLPVQNPSTTDVNTLDALLSSGPARYVDSAQLGEAGNVVIFGHSSHLPIVHNKMFQAFNNIPKLTAGDSITVVGKDGRSYLYSVDSVVKADVNDGTSISLAPSNGTKLTIVTCDTLTGKSARFVLTADFVGVE